MPFPLIAQQLLRRTIQHACGSSSNVSSQELRRICAHFQQSGPDIRAELGRKFAGSILHSQNKFTMGVFKAMNAAMWIEGQPITQEHRQILEDKLLKEQSGLLETLIAENPHVMKSTGNTPIYLAGRYLVHKPLSYWIARQKQQ